MDMAAADRYVKMKKWLLAEYISLSCLSTVMDSLQTINRNSIQVSVALFNNDAIPMVVQR
jgi:hypothetical protein